ncbi:peptidase C14 caspase catalytic subunit p20 [Neolewinella aurantiaca]|uniref:Peptidase C14 caspase catalytic subunit p20 n=1 Tax=Neolewinella aurantiaca TaxID=2602767 RepID=A0A5C7FYN9_9BACT|nr:caspase family protein [Neolewinella aurantiaca]TXF91726.1 peptidase C14 caspase catalytic subunit p20 [Neolewinella aurantiaca]
MSRFFLTLSFSLLCLVLSAQGNCVRGNCLDGNGKMVFPDGASYDGDFRRGKFQGTGVMKYPGGAMYVGSWHKSVQEGRGRMTEADGTSYIGGFHDGKRHGEGVITFANRNQMKAEFAFDKVKGEVTFTFANGDYYKGEMNGTTIEGYGTMNYVSGDVYTGEWKNNQRNGEGTMAFEDGTTLKGQWEGDNYHADWSRLGFQGDRANATDCNGGCPEGVGKYRYPNGTVFYGNVESGMPTGTGTVVYTNGNTYHGNFSGHQPEGLGIMYYADGEMHGGIWRSGGLYRKIFTAMGRPAQNIQPDFDPEVKVWAVVVGAARYTHMRTLLYTDDDAYQLAGFLRSIEGGALPDEQVRVLIDENATHRNIIMAMREVYQRADENDVILFYFSGHGLEGSFLPVDYDGYVNKLEHYQLKDALLASRARHKLVIADACHSGSLAGRNGDAQNAKSGGGTDATLNAYYSALNNAQASTALLLSSKGKEISLEDGGLRSGIFSHFLIRGMKGEADSNGDKLVSIQELFSYVHREVRQYTGNIQTPTLTGNYDELMPVSVIRGRR